jgi:hypothetical protein
MKRTLAINTIAFTVAFGASAAHADNTQTALEKISQQFSNAQLLSEPKIVDCTLTGGAKTECYSITVKAAPSDYTPGPWCPTHISDDAEAGGIWFVDGEVVDVDGEFIKNLAELYGDTKWKLYDDETGDIRYTGTLEACEAAARPDVDPEYNNYCVQCLPEYMSEDASVTYIIPVEPQAAVESSPTNQTGSGIAYNGVRLDGPAPVSDILSAYTVAPFDDCGGHVNTHVGYHYHAVTTCLEPVNSEDASATYAEQIGLAMDGYPIFAHTLADGTMPTDLDECNGRTTDELGYHYLAGASGSNAILGCLKAQGGCVFEDADMTCDASASVRPPRPEGGERPEQGERPAPE